LRSPRFVIAGLFTLQLAAVCPAPAAEPRAARLGEVSQAIEALAAAVSPAVVEIAVSGVGPSEGMEASGVVGQRRQTGSGVLLSADGEIVTNAHVIAGARRIVVTVAMPPDPPFPGRSILRPAGRRLEARVVGVDLETDLALLDIAIERTPFLRFGDSDLLRPGQLVVAVGSPLGLENSVTLGVVSAVGRQLEPESRMAWVQTDAPINPGNSGGALVNAAGELVGISTLIFSQSGGSEGIGFASPSNIVRHVVEQLRDFGAVRRGDVGATAQTITPAIATALGLDRTWGVILSDVRPRGPAEAAGLRPGDVVLELDGKVMENGRQLDVNLYRSAPGSQARFLIQRAGQQRTVTVAVSERENDPARFAAMVSRAESAVPRLGIHALEIEPQIAQMIPWLREPGGVIVAALSMNAPWSEDGGLRAGDVIHRANGKAVPTLAALRSLVDAQSAGAPLVLHVNRQGTLHFVTLELE
jgi:serine protease Do